MLPEQSQQLLTAAVDGELTKREKRDVRRLLQESEEARAVYHDLMRDSSRLSGLPRKTLPAHFSTQIVQKISEQTTVTPSTVLPAPRSWMPMWANAVAAVAVMLAVGAGSYLVIVLNDRDRANLSQAQNKTLPPENRGAIKPATTPILANNNGAKPSDDGEKPEKLSVMPLVVNDQANSESPKAANTTPADALTSPIGPKTDLATVDPPHLAPLLNVRDLDQPGNKRKLTDALKAGELAQLDLFCRDTGRASERLQGVLKARGQTVIVDALTQVRMNQKLRTYFVFYTEALSADELGKLFQQLAAEERNADARKDAQFDKLVVKSSSADTHKLLAQLLGVEPKWLQPKPRGASNDIPKSLTDSTAEKLARVGERSTNGSKVGESSVLVVGLNLLRTTPSKEVRQFLDHRKELRRDAVPVMIVVRTAE